MTAKLKVAYFGSDFLSLSLEAVLSRRDVSLEAVFASEQPGHGRVRTLARSTRLITERVQEASHGDILRSVDLLLSVGYNWKIPVGGTRLAVNIHPALLPACRGATPIPWILFDKPEAAGTTMHVMTDVLDDGPIIGKRRISGAEELSFHAYILICSQIGAGLTSRFLDDPEGAIAGAAPQDPAEAFYVSGFPVERRRISDQMRGRDIINVIRRLGPDGALLEIEGSQIKAIGGEFVPGGLDRPHKKIEINSVFTSMRCADGFIVFKSGELSRV